MGSTFQQRSRMRKLGYLLAMALLFTAALFVRSGLVEAQAARLKLREQDLGHVELTGKTVQLLSTGVRGVVTCGLWFAATEEQKRKDWPELENLTDSLTTLQPHFISAWLFQSWNLTYNVSVISDQATDQYYYIAKGIELQARGERQNQDHPDMRFIMGYYYQDKFGNADKRREYRCLFDLSCIDPRYRSSQWLRPDGKYVDLERFAQFCKDHPHLVRRIRRIRNHQSPGEVVDFMDANRKIETRYEALDGLPTANPPRLKDAEKRFPLLPPGALDAEEPSPDNGLFDSFSAGRQWFRYAQEPLPPAVSRPVPGIFDYDRSKYRLPRYMAQIIFRSYPAHAETFLAKALEKEGWYDEDGWTATNRDGFPDLATLKGDSEQALRVGTDHKWAEDAWSRSYNLWRDYGVANGLYIEDLDLAALKTRARRYMERYDLNYLKDSPVEPTPSERAELQDGYEAYKDLFWYRSNRSLTNFAHFYFESQVESQPLTVSTRKQFFLAEQFQELGSNLQALRMYRNPPRARELERYKEPKTLEAWKDIMLSHKDFRRDEFVQEDSYRMQRKYLRLAFRDLGLPAITRAYYFAQATSQPPGLLLLDPVHLLALRKLGFDLPVKGPLDGTDPEGVPLIGATAISQVRQQDDPSPPPPSGPPPGVQGAAPPGVPGTPPQPR